jgi:hypothetical protein
LQFVPEALLHHFVIAIGTIAVPLDPFVPLMQIAYTASITIFEFPLILK